MSYEDFANGSKTFKAYHYAPQPDGSYEVEEINCIVTELGLIIECKSFSPFAIVAVEDNGTDKNKYVVLTSDEYSEFYEGGTKLKDGIIKLEQGDNRTITVKAKEGYKIDTVLYNGEDIEEATIALNYNNLDSSTVIAATSVTATVKAKEEKMEAITRIQDVKFEAEKSRIAVGETTKTTIISLTEGSDEDINAVYSSSDKTIATVDSKGVIKGVKAGKVTITATVNGGNFVKEIEIEVYDENTGGTGSGSGNNGSGELGTDGSGKDDPNTGTLPKTSDIAIEAFVVAMFVSLIGIIFIVYKNNKVRTKKSK